MKIAIPYNRELYRLWFEYLKVARTSSDPLVRDALRKSEKFYAPWGNIVGVKFDVWWKTHGRLFEEKLTIRRLRRGDTPSDPNSLIIEVPLNKSPTELAKGVRVVIQEAFLEQGSAKTKSKKHPSSIYRPTDGAEPKLLALREMLTVYRDIFLRNHQLRGEKLLEKVHVFYKQRRNKRWAKVPMPLMTGGYTGIARPLRNLRRYIQKAESVMHNVARGEFPGKY